MESTLDQEIRLQLTWFQYSLEGKGRVSRVYQNFVNCSIGMKEKKTN